MYKLNIPEFFRRNSISLSPVSSTIEDYHTDPKKYFETQYKKITNTTCNDK